MEMIPWIDVFKKSPNGNQPVTFCGNADVHTAFDMSTIVSEDSTCFGFKEIVPNTDLRRPDVSKFTIMFSGNLSWTLGVDIETAEHDIELNQIEAKYPKLPEEVMEPLPKKFDYSKNINETKSFDAEGNETTEYEKIIELGNGLTEKKFANGAYIITDANGNIRKRKDADGTVTKYKKDGSYTVTTIGGQVKHFKKQ